MTFGPDLETVIMSTGSDSVAAPLDAEQEDPNSSTAADSPLNDADLRTPKRRKAAQRRVICVPADERQRGDGPPSDSWSWRKYGQKPIKGSPYPRGYYRCSSSKGCSARKQVERSRDDPSMLVITYTSDHSHGLPFNLTDTVSEKIEGTRDVELCNSPSKIEEEDEDFFADLGELPQSSSAINSRGSFFEEDETSSSCIAGHWYAMSSCI